MNNFIDYGGGYGKKNLEQEEAVVEGEREGRPKKHTFTSKERKTFPQE